MMVLYEKDAPRTKKFVSRVRPVRGNFVPDEALGAPWPPVVIEMALFLYYLPDSYARAPNRREEFYSRFGGEPVDNEIANRDLSRLDDEGLVDLDVWTLTSRGEAWVEHIICTPLPQQKVVTRTTWYVPAHDEGEG